MLRRYLFIVAPIILALASLGSFKLLKTKNTITDVEAGLHLLENGDRLVSSKLLQAAYCSGVFFALSKASADARHERCISQIRDFEWCNLVIESETTDKAYWESDYRVALLSGYAKSGLRARKWIEQAMLFGESAPVSERWYVDNYIRECSTDCVSWPCRGSLYLWAR